MRSNIFALTAGLAATTSAFDCSGHYFSFFNRPGNAMSYQRLDPALYPGTESPHLHSFDGANGLSSTTDFAETQSSSCTTARVKADKSLYWRPSLYFNDGKSFTRVPEKSTKIYYKSGDGDRWANVTGFPEDFNMIAGEPLKRSKGDNAAGVRWGCHQPDGGSTAIFDEGFPSGFSSCDYGFATEVTFPSCWNGEKLDPKNPNAHMAYPNGFAGVGIENCPTTHRAARFPTIFVEFWYDISSFKGKFGPNDKPWALSNGDPTGYGMHADFLNGWEKGVLEKATAETGGCNCGCGCGQTEMEQCFGKENVNSDSDPDWAQCDVTGIHAGEAEPALDKLPGCNPLQYGPAKATPVTGAGCNAVPAPTGSAKTSSAAYPEATPSSKHEEYPAMSIGIDMPAQAEKNEYSAMLPVTSSAVATPKESSVISFPTLIYSEGAYVMPSDVPSKDGECPVPVTVTYTPTVTVTATPVAAKVTPCEGQTYTATVTQTATVTVDAAEYGTY